ncbi:hypothetical protein AbraIFM66950_011400 [Aspergillus brasiliensis]|nr:hypothetical protein AbraIFM66950_011400 [Aspergillus brasiliensis]
MPPAPTDFTFKHAPSHDFGEEADYEPAPALYDREVDIQKYRKQYFYVEFPYEQNAAWSPLYVRQQLEQMNVQSPFVLVPLMRDGHEVPSLDPQASTTVQKAWELHNSVVPPGITRPKFICGETVLTCRRICSLYGYLDLEHPKPGTFRLMDWKPGFYEVVWRVQFFDPRERRVDRIEILNRFQQISGRPGFCGDEGYKNPMRFPLWDGADEASYPHRPLLRFSVGYGRSPRQISDYKLDYQLGHLSFADQVLLQTNEDHLRLDHMVDSKEYWSNKDSGWISIKSQGYFELVRGRNPVFVVSNIDTGDWQGGFRFGGVELKFVSEKSPT